MSLLDREVAAFNEGVAGDWSPLLELHIEERDGAIARLRILYEQ
jgi:hypothetical protein